MNQITLGTSIIVWLYVRKKYGDSAMSTIHSTTVVMISTILWIFMMNEGHLVSIMLGYFISDLYNVIMKKQYDMVFHHVFCTVFIYYIYHKFPHDNVYETNAVSKAAILEISTPFLNLYKNTKKPIYGIMLLITFFLSRIVWLTYIVLKNFSVPFEILGYTERLFMIFFVLLNYWWYMKMVRIAKQKLS